MITDREIIKYGISGVIRDRMKDAEEGTNIMFEREQVKSIETLRVLASRVSEEFGIKLSVKKIDGNYYVIKM